ncbi:MAG: methyltransferase [Bryobacteraceae bacterium]
MAVVSLRLGNSQEFACVRQALIDSHYTEATICERFGLAGLYAFSARQPPVSEPPRDALDLLIRLFLECAEIPLDMARSLLSGPALTAMEALDLIEANRDREARRTLQSRVILYPVKSLFLASDRPPGAGQDLATDLVYPAITPNTHRFLFMLPKRPCESLLELCAGTGVAALLGSQSATHAWACDINRRAVDFAEFNRRLNAIENATIACGDLWSPVEGFTFDRIVAHPPYMPALRQQHIFRDGGEDGELITREIVGKLSTFLKPGGSFYCTTMASDRKTATLEERVRLMLGPQEQEFDIVIATHDVFAPFEYYFRLAMAGEDSLDVFRERARIFQDLGIEQLLTCSLLIRRHVDTAPAITVRRQAGPATSNSEMEWLLNTEVSLQQEANLPAVLDMRPVASPHTRLRTTQAMNAGIWAATECCFEVDHPFALRAKALPWSTVLVAGCAGVETVREQFRRLQQSGALPPTAAEEDLARFVAALIRGGFLAVPEHEIPASPERDYTAAGQVVAS